MKLNELIMKNRFEKTFYLIIIFICGCQSTLDKASDNHKTAAEKWYALATYSQSSLMSYQVMVTAKLNIIENEKGSKYKLTNIKLNHSEDLFTINLISPVFNKKFICSPHCDYLNEYVGEKNEQGNTLLANYFSLHEYELFTFYGDLALLNDQLAVLSKKNEQKLYEYLRYLIVNEDSFDNLDNFSNYLNKKLSMESFLHFIDKPEDFYKDNYEKKLSQITLWKGYDIDETNHWIKSSSVSQDGIAITTDNEPLESSLWISEFNPITQRNITESKYKIDSYTIPTNVMNNKEKWLKSKKTKIRKDESVCSFTDNLFGIVKVITDDKIIVLVLGEAKIVDDGVVSIPPEGYLFGNNNDIHFQPIESLKSFKVNDVARCNFE
jgi:hypothetical protein